jgi:hypothetical protein
MCWPANISGAFFLALLIFDVIQKEYSNLPYHSIIGIIITGMLWVLCFIVGANITGAVLIIPCIFIAGYFFTIWFINESLKQRGCCMKCGEEETTPTEPKGTAYLVKKDESGSKTATATPTPTPSPTPITDFIKKLLGMSTPSGTCVDSKLTATPLTA